MVVGTPCSVTLQEAYDLRAVRGLGRSPRFHSEDRLGATVILRRSSGLVEGIVDRLHRDVLDQVVSLIHPSPNMIGLTSNLEALGTEPIDGECWVDLVGDGGRDESV